MKLPSGRVISLRERPTYGDMTEARRAYREAGVEGGVHAFNVTLMSRMSGLTAEEIDGLDYDDGDALQSEVDRRVAPRSVDQERFFETPSRSTTRRRAKH